MPRAEIIAVDPSHPNPVVISRAATIILAGGLVAFPTETVYGLGANALDPIAIQRIYAAKGRPASDPLIVHVNDLSDLSSLTKNVPPILGRLAGAFWPGPLTVVLERGAIVPHVVTADSETVAIRIPSHPVARALIAAAGRPIAAPSANLFAHISPTTAGHVNADLGDRIEMILDAGPSSVGVESTVLDLTCVPPRLLRPGGITQEDLLAIIGDFDTTSQSAQNPRSPGTAQRHYAPNTAIVIIDDDDSTRACATMFELAREARRRGHRVGVLAYDDDFVDVSIADLIVESLGAPDDDRQHAHRLYSSMRALEDQKVDLIIGRLPKALRMDVALRDRLRRAANGRVVHATGGHSSAAVLSSLRLPVTLGRE